MKRVTEGEPASFCILLKLNQFLGIRRLGCHQRYYVLAGFRFVSAAGMDPIEQ